MWIDILYSFFAACSVLIITGIIFLIFRIISSWSLKRWKKRQEKQSDINLDFGLIHVLIFCVAVCVFIEFCSTCIEKENKE